MGTSDPSNIPIIEKRSVSYSNKDLNYGILVPKPPSSFLQNERWSMPPAPFPDPGPDAPEPDGGNDGAPEPPWSEEEDGAGYLAELMAGAVAGGELTGAGMSGGG